MKIYFSIEPKIKTKSCIDLRNDFTIIDVDRVAQSMGYPNYLEDTYAAFIVEFEIKKRIKSFYKNKKTLNLLYIPKTIDIDFLPNFKKSLEKLEVYFLQYILIDCHNKLDESLYPSYDTVI